MLADSCDISMVLCSWATSNSGLIKFLDFLLSSPVVKGAWQEEEKSRELEGPRHGPAPHLIEEETEAQRGTVSRTTRWICLRWRPDTGMKCDLPELVAP